MATNDDSQDNTDCPICLKTTTNPVTMPCCQNQFCMKCMDGWRNDLDEYIRGNRTCPCCRALVPPTQHVLEIIQFYKSVSLSLQILLQDPFLTNLPLPPFYSDVERMNPVAIRQDYEGMETIYGLRVRLFEQNYSPGTTTSMILPSLPPKAIHLPVSVVQAIRANHFYPVLRFFGHLPIPPQHLNAMCPSENGNTILHIAVQENNLDMVNVLLALGANVNASNSENLTPLYYALIKKMEGNDDRVAKALIRWGAKKVVHRLDSSISSLNLLAGTSDHLLAASIHCHHGNKPQLARMLENEALGRHCKVLVDGITRRGTTINSDIDGTYHVTLDGCQEQQTPHVAPAANVEICKPLLFDFRNIHRAALFPNPQQPPRAHNIRQIFQVIIVQGVSSRTFIPQVGNDNVRQDLQEALDQLEQLVVVEGNNNNNNDSNSNSDEDLASAVTRLQRIANQLP